MTSLNAAHGGNVLRMTRTPPSEVSKRLREERWWRGMTQAQFGELMGVTGATISVWERGRVSRIGRKLIELLCHDHT